MIWLGVKDEKNNPPLMQTKGTKVTLLPLQQTNRVFSGAVQEDANSRIKLPTTTQIELTATVSIPVQLVFEQLMKRQTCVF